MVPRPRPLPEPEIADMAPSEDALTDYDYRLLVVYMRLLDAAKENADWRDVTRIVLKIDADKEPLRARRIYDTHLARASWMTKRGYRHLLQEADGDW